MARKKPECCREGEEEEGEEVAEEEDTVQSWGRLGGVRRVRLTS